MSAGHPFLVHTESSLAWGGQEIRILTELKYLKARGWRVELWAPRHADVYYRSKAVQIAVERVPFKRVWDPLTVWNVRKLIGEKRPDVIVTHSSVDSWIAGLATRGAKVRPAIVRMRHLSTPIRNFFSYKRFPDAIGTTSDDIRKMLIGGGVAAEKIVTLPTGVDLKRFRPNPAAREAAMKFFKLPEDRPVVGGVFVIRSWKGIYDFVKIAAALPHTHFVVAGVGPSKEAMMKSAADAGVADRMTFTGHVEAVEEIFWALDAFLFPSTSNEGIPQAVLQAQACGVPLVMSDLPSLREAATGAVACPVGDIGAFAASVKDLLSDPEHARSVTAAGAEWVKRFDQAKMLEDIEAFYRRLIGRH